MNPDQSTKDAEGILEKMPYLVPILQHVERMFYKEGSHPHLVLAFAPDYSMTLLTPFSLENEAAKDTLSTTIKCFAIVHRPESIVQIFEMWRWMAKDANLSFKEVEENYEDMEWRKRHMYQVEGLMVVIESHFGDVTIYWDIIRGETTKLGNKEITGYLKNSKDRNSGRFANVLVPANAKIPAHLKEKAQAWLDKHNIAFRKRF